MINHHPIETILTDDELFELKMWRDHLVQREFSDSRGNASVSSFESGKQVRLIEKLLASVKEVA